MIVSPLKSRRAPVAVATCGLALLALLAGASASLAQPATADRSETPSRMSPELLWKLGRIGAPTVAPDGSIVVWTVRRYDLAENSGTSDLQIASTDGGPVRTLLTGWKSLSDLQFAGNGEEVALWFVGRHEGIEPDAPQLFRVPVNELLADPTMLDPHQLTAYADGVANLKVAPNGTRFVFTRDVKLDQTVNELYADLPKADARIIDSLMFRHWNAWHDYAYSHLHVAEVRDLQVGAERDLMAGQRNDSPVGPFGGAEQIAWAPDSQHVVYTTKIAPFPAESTDSSLWMVDVISESPARLLTDDRPGYDNDPFFSADGRLLGYHSMVRPGFEADRNRVMLLDPATNKLIEATEGLDQSAQATRFFGDDLFFNSDIDGTTQIFRLTPGGAISQVTSGDFNWSLVEVLPGGEAAIALRQSMLRPDELFRIDLTDPNAEAVAISHVNDEIYAGLELPTFVRRQVTATDGQTILCWVALPPDFDPNDGKKWPLLLYAQGGPQSQIGQWFSYRWNFHLMAAKGYVVIAPNRRGLPGFGQKWNDDISGDWGGQAMQDLLSATDDISREPWIDSERRGAIGASFGGYTVYWLMGNHQQRFNAMIAHCGVFNLESMYGSTEELFFVNWDLNGPYWSSPETAAEYERFSPHKFIANWETPLLVIHGEKDFRVPITQGIEAFTAAQVRRIPSRFLYFPDEGHWVMGPQNSVLWHRVFFDWLDRHLTK